MTISRGRFLVTTTTILLIVLLAVLPALGSALAVTNLPQLQPSAPLRSQINEIGAPSASSTAELLRPLANSPSSQTSAIVSVISGLTDVQGGAIPPDMGLGVGPNHVMQMVNNVYQIWDKTGVVVKPFSSNAGFFSTLDSVSDPFIVYDAISGRWFVAIFDLTEQSTLLRVSTTSDPTGTWGPTNHFLARLGATVLCPDQPYVGMTSDKVVITTNDFSTDFVGACAQPHWGPALTVISKADLLNLVASPNFVQAGPLIGFGLPRPAVALSQTSTLFLVGTETSSVDFWTIDGVPPGTVSLTTNLVPIDPNNPISNPPKGNQLGSSVLVETGDARALSPVWESNMLWFGVTTGCIPGGDTVVRSCSRLIELNTATSTVVQDIIVGTSGAYLFYPALRMDSVGDLVAVIGESSSSIYPKLIVAVRNVTDAPGSLEYANLADGLGPVPDNRYGDYFAASVDPMSPADIWVAGEIGPASSHWATKIGHISMASGITGPSMLSIVRGTGGSLWWSGFASSSWSGWASLAGSSPNATALCRSGWGVDELVVRGNDNGIWHKTFANGAWSAWDGPLIGATRDQPACAVLDGLLHVVVRGFDDGLWYNTRALSATGVWGTWTSLSGTTLSPPVLVASPAAERLDLVVRGSDGGVWHKDYVSGSWSSTWDTSPGTSQNPGGVTSDIPAAVSDGGTLHVVVRRTDNTVSYNSLSFAKGSWSSWTFLGKSTLSSPSLVIDLSGAVHLVIGETNGQIQHRSKPLGDSWSISWDTPAGTTQDKPALTLSAGNLALLIRGGDQGVWYNTLVGSTWQTWKGLGGTITAAPTISNLS